MEDCKCGRLSDDILDMQVRITDKLAKDVIEGVRTPDWVKNMLAGVPEQLSRAEYEILEEILKEKNRFMEEKKTKKMTKAEAFEYLKGKKVNCYDGTNNLYCKLVKKMWDCGCEYKGFMCPPTYSVSALAVDRKGRIGHVPTEIFDRYINLPFEEISADDILSIEIVEEKCELEFNYDKVVELAKPLMHYLNEIGCSDSIRVSQLGIVHEPMSTLIFDNGIGE